tara:strand:+ start:435 stop:1040 length:606 start_codon:yes stop_codon:yes gene_type:complete
MNNLVQTYEKKQINKLTSKKRIPAFRSGDTIKVTLKIVEGERSRYQAFEGLCIARKNNSLNSKFTLRKISHGEGVERVFPLFSPIIDKIEVIRKGNVNRAKLYYLRNRTGKKTRISDRDRGDEEDQYSFVENIESQSDDNLDNIDVSEAVDKTELKTEDENLEDKADSVEKMTNENEEDNTVQKKSESESSDADKTENESK